MAASSPPQVQASSKPFWNKMLSAWKVKRILESRGFDAERFRRDYEADSHRGPRRPGRPPIREIEAVENFLKSGVGREWLREYLNH